MARLVCEEFDEFVDALPGLQGEYVLRARPARDWRLRSVDLVLDTAFRTVLPVATGAGQRRRSEDHKQMLHRALELLEKLEDTMIRTSDLCTAVGASERTVRNIFNDYLGMSPHRYLMTRRLHAIRSAIHHATPADTITSICARYGVWDFGRFAKLYKEHFGVLPSQDLYGRKLSRPNRVAAIPVH